MRDSCPYCDTPYDGEPPRDDCCPTAEMRSRTIADVVAFVRGLAGLRYPESRGKLHDIADDIEKWALSQEQAPMSASCSHQWESSRAVCSRCGASKEHLLDAADMEWPVIQAALERRARTREEDER